MGLVCFRSICFDSA